jgi:hypothetical protein
VEEIDNWILKGERSHYGMRGGNVIAVYPRGQFMRRGVIEFDMLAYNTPKTFYEPHYQPEDEPAGNYSLVWNPVILTDRNGKATVVFSKPAIQGDYRFIIEGASYVGLVGSEEKVISNQ